jgi:glycosyltransferase involved in cell wall biosynthesis
MQVVQIVKKFGPVGGMEDYVFRFSVALFKSGCNISVLCEENHSREMEEIEVIELGVNSKPHWLSHFKFSKKVDHWLARNPQDQRIVHSHERQSTHHITTFHTTPYNLHKPWIKKWLSLRNFFYEKLEERELFGRNINAIVPVSNLLGDLIKKKHPESANFLRSAIHPGVDMRKPDPRAMKAIPLDGGTIGFIGKEWKRKGLPKVFSIWRELKKKRPNLKLKIAGVKAESISHLLEESDVGVDILGVIKDKESFYQSIDLLVHPAKLEAFGMVITEALVMNISVLCSKECGASEVQFPPHGIALPHKYKNSFWIKAAEHLLCANSINLYERKWKDVALEYEKVYKKLLN